MLLRFFETFTDFDNKLISSIVPLISKPGFLSREYLEGKRMRYLNPIQMYAFFSFIFFLAYFYLPDLYEEDIVKNVNKELATAVDSAERVENSIRIGNTNEKLKWDFGDTTGKGVLLDGKRYTLASYDSIQKVLPDDKKDSFLKRALYHKILYLNSKGKEDSQSLADGIVQIFEQNLPNLIICLLPFFALLLKLIYIRGKRYYVEHLIFATHFHCFAFLFFCILLIYSKLISPISDWALPVLIAEIYMILAMKRLYQQGWTKTLFKAFLLSLGYLVFIAIGLIFNLLITFVLVE